MPVPLFENQPGVCPEGHYIGPGLVTIGWMPCGCGPAREARSEGSGHHYIVCRVCEGQGVRTWMYDPPHDAGHE